MNLILVYFSPSCTPGAPEFTRISFCYRTCPLFNFPATRPQLMFLKVFVKNCPILRRKWEKLPEKTTSRTDNQMELKFTLTPTSSWTQ